MRDLISRQDDVTDTNVGETISRQAAIAAVSNWLYDRDDGRSVDQLLSMLPSAQPEIIHCRECKHWEQESVCDGYCSEIEKDGFDEDHFCSYAERREE